MTKPSLVGHDPIAIVGVSALFPGSVGTKGFWHDILRGKDLLTDVPATHWLLSDYYDPDPHARDKTYANRGGFLPDVDFDPLAFGVPPSNLPATDTSQLLALIVAQQVLEDASRGDLGKIDRDRTSVILGVTSAQELLGTMISRLQKPVWAKALRDMGLPESKVEEACDRIASHYVEWQESSFPGLLGNVVAGRIANRLDLGGTNCVCDAACASTFSALAMAVNELHTGMSDLVITGGVDTMNDIFMYVCFSKTPALSPTGDCRPFSDRADGTMLGEGMGMVALKRLADAEAAGDPIYGLVRGVGSSSDGRAKSVYAPVPEGQAKALRRAYAQAGYGADTVELVEAHGTGTMAGDAAELAGLRLVFQDTEAFAAGERQFCALGSVKSQIGHTKSAAGAAGLFKAVMALHHKVLPSTIKIERPSPKLDLENSPFHLATATRPWIRNAAQHPRRAGVSSFGFGGSNFHIALEEYLGPSRAKKLRTAPTELVVVSAPNRGELGGAASALAAEVRAMLACTRATAHENEATVLQHVAARTQRATHDGDARASIVAESATDLLQKLDEVAGLALREGFVSSPRGVVVGSGPREREVCVLFPGQGSQYVGMGAGLAQTYDAARAVWDAAESLGSEPLSRVVFPRPSFQADAFDAANEKLTRTEWAQPAIGAASLATLSLLRAAGLPMSVAIGHSFGEVTALAAAGALTPLDALRVAERRGACMAAAAASAPGAMCAVLASRDAVVAALEGSGIGVVIANHNGPAELVLSGETLEIERAEALLADKSLATKRLRVSTAFHSPVVRGAVAPFREFLGSLSLQPCGFDVLADASAAPYPADAAGQRETLATQLESPVRFVDAIEAAYARGVRTFVEVGPSAVLTGLVSRILEGRLHHAVATDRKGKDSVTALYEALGRLFVIGVPLSLGALLEEFAEVPDPRATVAPKMAIKINGSNYGKIHPANPVGTKPGPVTVRVHAPEAPTVHASPKQEVPMSNPREAAAVVPAPTHEAPPTDVHLAWVAAYQEAQRQTVEAHVAYQQSTAETHQAFLRAVEAGFHGLASLLTGAPMPRADVHVEPRAPAPPPRLPSAPVVAAPRVAVSPSISAAPAPAYSNGAANGAHAANGAAHTQAPAPAPAAPSAAAAPVDLERTMLEVVAAKTGYPIEMLGAEMDLEADLGVDSIKRVEILAALRERNPTMPQLDMAKLGAMRTLAQIVAYVREVMPEAAPAAASAPVATAQAPKASAANGSASHAAPSAQVTEQMMLEVVAAKTGYPVEMLGSDMDLEADLGVDSIKRVEILAALRERTPSLPQLDMAKLGAMRTLAQIVGYVQEAMGGVSGSSAATRLSPKASAPEATGAGRWVTAIADAPALGFSIPGLSAAKRCVVTDDRAGIAPAVVAALGARGIAATVVSEVPADADAVIFLGALAPDLPLDAEGSLALHRAGLGAARALARTATATGGVFVTVQDTGGDFGVSGSPRAWLGGLPGLVKTAAQEWPLAGCRALDVERGARSPAAVGAAIADELLAGGLELEVGLSAEGRRRTVVSVRTPLGTSTAARLALDPGAVVVVSGGARGVTAACVLALVRETRCRIVVLGRTAVVAEPKELAGAKDDASLKRVLLAEATASGKKVTPAELSQQVAAITGNREVSANLAAIEQAGGAVRYAAVDVSDAAAVATVLDEARAAWGPIAGVIHGAGVIADKLIAEKTDAQFERVFSTKARGLFALLAATASDPLRFFLSFSSVAGRAGNRGQCDYSMANEVLDKVAAAEQVRRPACTWKSIGWGPWESGMVSPALRAHFEAAGVPLVTLEGGPRAMLDELAAGNPPVHVVVGPEPRAEALVETTGPRSLRTRELEVLVDRATHAFIDDHRVKGQAVVPVVMVAEWFARAAQAWMPERVLASIDELKVLRGIKLAGFDGAGDRLTVRLRELGGDRLEATVVGAKGAPHYSATLRLAAARPSPRAPLTLSGPRTPWAGQVYGAVLFHGPRCQVIKGQPALASDGIEAELVGTREAGWSGAFVTDPALLDGGLQLVLCFTKEATGGASLPTGWKSLRWFGGDSDARPIRCVVRSRKLSADHTSSDLVFVRGDTVVAELDGVEAHVLPGTRAAATVDA